MYPMKLEPVIIDNLWGGMRLINEYGMKAGTGNASEAWMLSCVGKKESIITNGAYAGQTLLSVFAGNKSICGYNGSDYEKFPILIKFIDALDDLSIQVHPDDDYAQFIGEGAGKTEAWYILDCDEGAELILGFKKEITEKEFLSAIEKGEILDFVQKFKVKKGDFFFIEAGTLHAICKGVLLAEVQQSSETTYRIFDYNRKKDGKPRELHVDKAIDVTKRVPYVIDSNQEQNREITGGSVKTLLKSCDFFTVSVLDISVSFCGIADESSFVSLLVLEGSGELSSAGERISIKKGGSIFIPAGCGSFEITGEIKILETRI
jgi:mannose-6-phosphate isomerase